MRRFTTLAAFLPFALLLLAACSSDAEAPDGPDDSGVVTDSAETGTDTGTPTPEPTPFVNVCGANPSPGSPEQLRVDSPSAGDTVTIPFNVSGAIASSQPRYRAFVYRADGSTAGGVTVQAEQTGAVLQDFSVELNPLLIEPFPACIWIYELDPSDTPLHVVQVPVFIDAIVVGGTPAP